MLCVCCLETCLPISHLSMSLAGDDLTGSLKAWRVDEEVGHMKEEEGIGLPETEEENDGEEASKRGYRKRKKREHNSTSRELGTVSGLADNYISKGVSNRHCPISQPASPATAPSLPHLLHFTAEEIAAAPGIEAETFPEMSFTESLPESPRSHTSLKFSPRCAQINFGASLQPAAMFSEEVMSNHSSRVSDGPLKASDKHHKQPTPSPRKMKQHSPEATSSKTRSYSTVRADSLKFKHHTTSLDRELRTGARRKAAEVDESR